MSRPRAPRIAGKILRAILLAVVFAVTGLAVWRACFSSGEPKAVRAMVANETLAEAYAAADGNLNCYRQEQATVTRAPSNYGYFSVTQCVFIPEAKQVQLVFRYNNSTLKHLAEDKGLQETPPKSGTYFDVTLIKSTPSSYGYPRIYQRLGGRVSPSRSWHSDRGLHAYTENCAR